MYTKKFLIKKIHHYKLSRPRGRGMDSMMKKRKGEISGMLEVRVYAMDFFKLSKIRRPSSTPVTMEAKLSSNKIMSAASLETSDPAIPMAIPDREVV